MKEMKDNMTQELCYALKDYVAPKLLYEAVEKVVKTLGVDEVEEEIKFVDISEVNEDTPHGTHVMFDGEEYVVTRKEPYCYLNVMCSDCPFFNKCGKDNIGFLKVET